MHRIKSEVVEDTDIMELENKLAQQKTEVIEPKRKSSNSKSLQKRKTGKKEKTPSKN